MGSHYIDDETLHTVVYLAPPAVHVDVTLKKQSSAPDAGYPSGPPVADRKACQLMSSAAMNINWNTDYIPANNIGGEKKKELLPKTKDLVRKKVNETSFCYKINNSTGLTVEWSVKGDKVSMSVSAKSKGYVSMGFYPAWPGMIKAQIILGGEQCGVQQFEAQEYVGSPTPSNWTTLTSPKIQTTNGLTTMSWTFPTPSLPKYSQGQIMWALGSETPAACQYPSYHGALRGSIMLPDFTKPFFPDWMKC